MTTHDAGAEIDEALANFSRCGPEFGPGLANHGPMAADALIAMGRADDVMRWSEWYAGRLAERPRAISPIDADGWRDALGDPARVADWTAYFERALDGQAWTDVLDTWVLRLGPGVMAGATHGILRTAHAVRSLGRGETPARQRELAEGLAYWVARYQELPSIDEAARGLPVADALAFVPAVDVAQRKRGMIFDAVKGVDPAQFAPVINLVDPESELDAFVSDVTRTFVRQYIVNAPAAAIAFVHTVTAPSALRILAPHLSAATRRAAMRYLWQACASIYAAYAGVMPPGAREAGDIEVDRDDLIEQAVNARDEHAIKFTEACLREYAISHDAAFLTAAQDAVRRLRVTT